MAEQGNHTQWTEGDPWFCVNRVFISGDNARSRLGHGGWANASTFKIIIINQGCYLLREQFSHKNNKWINGTVYFAQGQKYRGESFSLGQDNCCC